jgi:hypothetical protein
MKLNREDLSKIKVLAQRGDYDSIVALLDHYISETLEVLVETKQDHRFIQGKLRSLSTVRHDIVSKGKN